MGNQKEHRRPNWSTANKSFYKEYNEVIKGLKQNMTQSEKILWEHIRNKQLGIKFRRQHVIGTFIVDFVALSLKLIIEIDGKIHLARRKEDNERTEWLNMNGYKVIRFKNEEVENELDKVIEKIKLEIGSLTPPNLPNGEAQER